MKIYNPHKIAKKLIKKMLTKKSKRRKVITADDIDHRGTELVDDLGPLPSTEEEKAFGLQVKGYHAPELEDGL